ncbi:MAG: branched-chain amino acid ABC transporter substrate-binding protein [Candidatus Competibacteraceae bacterium]|nr:branched-chain amino acid ABC transporter substrate-binding protein [Candidatus Competibacteraceae bacterium]
MKRLTNNILAATVGALILAGQAQAQDPVKIAVVGPITGPVAQYGDMQMIGARMAIERINDQGGAGGHELIYMPFDDVCEPKQAVAVANQIVNEGIQFVVGHLCSGSTQPAAAIYDDEGILMITPASTSPAITEQGYTMVFRTIGLDSQQGPKAGNFIVEEIEPERMAIIHDKQQYGQGIAEEVRDTVQEGGVDVVLFEGVSKGQTDFSALITKLKRENVDFVYYGGYHPELGLILRQAREQGFDATFMGPEGVGNKDISAIAGPASEGLLVTLPMDFSEDPANADLVAAFEERDEDPSGPFVMPSYAAVKVIADSIERTGGTDPIEIAEMMRQSSYETPIGTVAFNEHGDLQEFEFVIYEWHADASKTPVKETAP